MEQYLDLATAKANNAESLWCPVWVVSCMLKVEIFYSCCSKKKSHWKHYSRIPGRAVISALIQGLLDHLEDN